MKNSTLRRAIIFPLFLLPLCFLPSIIKKSSSINTKIDSSPNLSNNHLYIESHLAHDSPVEAKNLTLYSHSSLEQDNQTEKVCIAYAKRMDYHLEKLKHSEQIKLLTYIKNYNQQMLALERENINSKHKKYFLSFCIQYADKKIKKLSETKN